MTDTSIVALGALPPVPSLDDTDPTALAEYWFGYITESAAADFLGYKVRQMQALRQRGDGPKYHQFSSRCLRYRRIDLKEYAEKTVRTSTSDDGLAA